MKGTLERTAFSLALVFLIMAPIVGTGRTHGQVNQSLDLSPVFSVEFSDCVESIGVTLAPTERVRTYVPDRFILVGEGQPLTPLVVRTARCNGIATADHKEKSAEIVQIGAVIVPPDLTGDINNYTIWYSTSAEKLATQLSKVGINAQLMPTIDYQYQPGTSSFSVQVPMPGEPRLTLSGTVQPSSAQAGSFTANWWQETDTGVVKMSTNVPIIKIGFADLTLTTEEAGPLGQVIGGSSTGFPIIQQFNTFTNARMQVEHLPT